MTRIPSRKDSLASFILTVGAADMVIGGVGDRGSLFALGLLTAGSAMVIRWLRQRRRSFSMLQMSSHRQARPTPRSSMARASRSKRAVMGGMTANQSPSRQQAAKRKDARHQPNPRQQQPPGYRTVSPQRSSTSLGLPQRSMGRNFVQDRSHDASLPQGPPLNLPQPQHPRSRRQRR